MIWYLDPDSFYWNVWNMKEYQIATILGVQWPYLWLHWGRCQWLDQNPLTSIKIDRSSFWSFWDICLCKPSLGAAKKGSLYNYAVCFIVDPEKLPVSWAWGGSRTTLFTPANHWRIQQLRESFGRLVNFSNIMALQLDPPNTPKKWEQHWNSG